MKYKLLDVSFNDIEYIVSKEFSDGNIITNVKYLGQPLEFQTPKVLIKDIIKESGKEYLYLEIFGNLACKKFVEKLLEFESRNTLKSVFQDNYFIVKVPFVGSKPTAQVYSNNGQLFNYYHLAKGMEIICLIRIDKLWNNTFYHLQVKEIMLLKNNN